jgi:hypothetical protein
MTTMLDRPADLGADHWSAIEAHADRLERARRDGDLTLVIGSAKDLVEAIAKIVLKLSGEQRRSAGPAGQGSPRSRQAARAGRGRGDAS